MSHTWESRWTLGARLGKGGQGVTHLATFNEDTSVQGALKYLKNNRDSQARGRMRREVASLQTLANAGGAVPRVLDHNTERFDDISIELYVVMDFVPGATLTDHVSRHGPLDLSTAIGFTLSLCKTIELAHTFPVLHRDLKPDNIIVRNLSKNDLVVVDFGLSFNASDEEITETDETFRNRFLDLPETNTPSGNRRDPRSDLTAVCAILYYCLTCKVPGQLQDGSGAPPHRRQGFSLLDAQDNSRVPLLIDFFDRGFAPNIANRFQRVDEIVARLNEIASSGAELDESDPIQLAAALSQQLRANDRITQLAEFQEYAQDLFAHIQNEARKYHKKLGRFQLLNAMGGFGGGGFGGGGFGGGGFGGDSPLENTIPQGLDLVAFSPVTISLQAANHQFKKHRRYAVASRGEQCVLLSADFEGELHQPANQSEWQEVAWFEADPQSIYNLVSLSYKDWLNAKIKELTNQILNK